MDTFFNRWPWKDAGRFGENMAVDVLAKIYAATSQAKNICRNVSYDMWGIPGVCTLALTVTKTSSHYDRFAVSVSARSLLLSVRPRLARWEYKRPQGAAGH